MSTLIERLFEIVSEKADGKHTIFAKNAGIPTSTFQGYIKGRPPHTDHLIRIHEYYGINIDWILTGKEPKYVDCKDASESSAYIYKKGDSRDREIAEDSVQFSAITGDDPCLDDLLNMTRAVIKSGTGYSHSLAANIHSFYKAVQNEKRFNGIEERLDNIEQKIKQTNDIRTGDDQALRGEILKKRRA